MCNSLTGIYCTFCANPQKNKERQKLLLDNMRILVMITISNLYLINDTKCCFKYKYRQVLCILSEILLSQVGGRTKATPACVNVSADYGDQNRQEVGGMGMSIQIKFLCNWK